MRFVVQADLNEGSLEFMKHKKRETLSPFWLLKW
ncbi:Uncharacterised protein [Vibrio cholerae]|nr:Uncharacterised protein [Vibrio cholerae]